MPRRAASPQEDVINASAVPALDRAVRILDLLSASPARRFPLSEIARTLVLPKSTTLNLCNALERVRMLRRSREGYQLGRRLVQLGSDYVASVDPVREFYEVCRTAPADLGALVQLAVLDDGLNAVFLAREDLSSGLRLGLTAEIGRRVPAYFTASGKALLAALDHDEFEARLLRENSLGKAATPKSVSSLEQVRSAVALARSEGYGRDDEETVAGIACVGIAVPTTHRDSDHVAMSISATTANLDRRRKAELLRVLSELAASLRDRL